MIERAVPEFANPGIVHNVEFSLHPIRAQHKPTFAPPPLPLTAAKVQERLPFLHDSIIRPTQVLARNKVKRNATVLAENEYGPVVANIDSLTDSRCDLTVSELRAHPLAIFECKRVGVEEGMRKGPQTIEKAKQGAYVARSLSSLQLETLQTDLQKRSAKN